MRIPIVVGAVIDDLSVGDGRTRPDPAAAVKACEAATTAGVPEGSVGVGAGATVGKMFRTRLTKLAMMVNIGAARAINPYPYPGRRLPGARDLDQSVEA